MAAMTLEEFVAKYALGPNGTFLADDRGGNAASEVAGQNVADYYRTYLADGVAPRTQQVGGWDNPNDAAFNWGGGTTRDALRSQVGLDAWSNVDPHPESNRLDGIGEFWKQVGKPAAIMAAAGFGANALNGLVGAGAGGGFSGVGGTGGSAGIGSGTVLGGAAPTASTAAGTGFTGSMAMPGLSGSMPAGVTSFSSMVPAAAEVGSLLPSAAGTGTLGGATAVGGGLIGNGSAAAGAASMGAGSGVSDLLGRAGSYLSDPSNLLSIGGTVLGAVGGAAASRDTTTSNSSNRDPWVHAQPYLRDNLATNAAMAEHYRQNPFSELQQQQYQGLFNNLANNQANAPGLLANASSFGQSTRGRMPAMQGLISGTQAPAINWSAYQNIGRRG